ncbi:catalase family peroxidase (plasmid) [Polymorphobacter sp. PAMC 29334]|uniref:catalase family peroxidase n=1 Tax=Polymorphobacter sp. PAMC 29334 TaxID=2862331 RepID=UPI001C678337|nr:catalase family peroxidase [Polymorphobacter sp. PAMC 29334]QYE33274.1 catalase family peroxidase [Polymorphobacter sp. PAMC 29334]
MNIVDVAPGHRLAAWPCLLAAGIIATAIVAPARGADQADLPGKLVTDLHATFGDNHARAIHAKGIVLTGHFDPAPGANAISKAPLFRHASPIIVRFSDFTGLPAIPDNDENANPRGLAIKFGTVDDASLDIVAHSFNGFPVSNATDFGHLFEAIAASGPKAAKPTALDKFLAAHPVAKTFLTTQKSPTSFTTTGYFGVNSFRFIDARGHSMAVRYRFVPAAGEHYLDSSALKSKPADYLMRDIAVRVHQAPIRFDWFAQVAGTGDVIDDPVKAWPDTRRLVKLGTITIDKLATDQAGLDKQLMFLPGNVPAGIEAADPMIGVRTAGRRVTSLSF